jgi:hypothetical protein
LTSNFDIRGTPTRNCLIFPIIDLKQNVIQNEVSNYNIENNFAPIQKNAPFVNFASNIDRESCLRSQIYALQNGAEQSVYVPSSKSDLYNIPIPKSSHNVVQPFAGLFVKNSHLKTTHNDFIHDNRIGLDNLTITQKHNYVDKLGFDFERCAV